MYRRSFCLRTAFPITNRSHAWTFIDLQVDTGKLPPFCREGDGRAWCDHYCQFTSIPTPSELCSELATGNRALRHCRRESDCVQLRDQAPGVITGALPAARGWERVHRLDSPVDDLSQCTRANSAHQTGQHLAET